MGAKIYNFEDEKVKRMIANYDVGQIDETAYGIYMKMTVEEFERLNIYKPLSTEGLNQILEDLGAETLKDK